MQTSVQNMTSLRNTTILHHLSREWYEERLAIIVWKRGLNKLNAFACVKYIIFNTTPLYCALHTAMLGHRETLFLGGVFIEQLNTVS